MLYNSPKEIIIHGSDVSWKQNHDQFAAINTYHRDEGFLRSSLGLFVGYHRLITGGKNYKCKEDWEEGCHCNQAFEDGQSVNLRSLGICAGFDGDIEQMYPADYSLLQKQIFEWQDQYHIPNERVKFHRWYNKAKTCPGSLLDDQWLKNLLTRTATPTSQTPPASPPQPSAKPEEQCEKQEAIIATQSAVISLYERITRFFYLSWIPK